MVRLDETFFHRDRLTVAPELVGKLLVHTLPTGETRILRITETEAYGEADDTACHAHRGRTPRNDLLYRKAGTIYVYLCYGMHWMLNFITGEVEHPQGVLIRACETAAGPGRLTKALGITGALNATHISDGVLTVCDDSTRFALRTAPRVGIGYATPEDQARQWRFILDKRLD